MNSSGGGNCEVAIAFFLFKPKSFMIDNKLTIEIQTLLQKETLDAEEIRHGAELLLRINRNRALNQLINRNPKRYERKLVYELNKHLAYRLDGLTLQEVRSMDKEVTAVVDALIEEGKPEEDDDEPLTDGNAATPKLGKRADHDTLPAEIQALWTRNAERWKKIKEARATVETLEMACDRYEYLKFMKEAYTAYKTDMAKYDEYTEDGEGKKDASAKVSSARSYISKNRPKYEELASSADTAEQAAALKEKIQQRVDTILNASEALSDDLKAWLVKFNFDAPTDEA